MVPGTIKLSPFTLPVSSYYHNNWQLVQTTNLVDLPTQMKIFSTLFLLSAVSFDTATGFAPGHSKQFAKSGSGVGTEITIPLLTVSSSLQPKSLHPTILKSKDNDIAESDAQLGFWSDVSINPPYAVAFVTFLAFAFYRSFTEPDGASTKVLEGFFADPLNPGCNELFVTIFNLLGLYFVPISCLVMPGAKGQKFPATPFLLGSMLGGYGFLGPYMMTRKPSLEIANKSELGWFTTNVLENKIVNWTVLAVISSAYVSSGFINALLDDSNKLLTGYGELFANTAIASASTMDFFILTLVAASLIPEDLARRGVKEGAAPYTIAASTVLLPGVGAALYCALRPELEE